MDFPLTLPTILERAEKIFERVEIVSRGPDPSIRGVVTGNFTDAAAGEYTDKTGDEARRPSSVDDVEPPEASGGIVGVPSADRILQSTRITARRCAT